jgi:hypothetical protein
MYPAETGVPEITGCATGLGILMLCLSCAPTVEDMLSHSLKQRDTPQSMLAETASGRGGKSIVSQMLAVFAALQRNL